jgi:hypothetical protein
MHTVGLAGVYGNPAPASQDFTKASPIPDDVWVAKYTSPPQLTIWALGALADSQNWTNGQRIHQIQQNVAQGWAAASYNVDPDIENAPVANPNAVIKSYTYSSTNIDCPGAISTIPSAMNDMNGRAIINGPGQIGTIVGTYQTSLTSPVYAYQSSAEIAPASPYLDRPTCSLGELTTLGRSSAILRIPMGHIMALY